MLGRLERGVRLPRSLALAVAATALASACAGGSERDAGRTTTGVVAPAPVPAPPAGPQAALDAFVAAAGRGDAAAMWGLLSGPSRTRLGPTLARFRRANAARLEAELGPIARSGVEAVLAEEIVGPWAVAAVAGSGRRRAFAAALRREPAGWRLELGAPIRIRPLRPDPGERVDVRTQLAAELKAPSVIGEAGLWLDGRAVPGQSGGLSPSYFTVFTESGSLRTGAHTVVALAIAGDHAAARAWTFSVQPPAA